MLDPSTAWPILVGPDPYHRTCFSVLLLSRQGRLDAHAFCILLLELLVEILKGQEWTGPDSSHIDVGPILGPLEALAQLPSRRPPIFSAVSRGRSGLAPAAAL